MILELLGIEAVTVWIMLARERRAAVARMLGRIRSNSHPIRWLSSRLGIDPSTASKLDQRLAALAIVLIRRLTQHEALDQLTLSAVQYLRRKRKGGF
jgi:hypothetical protein